VVEVSGGLLRGDLWAIVSHHNRLVGWWRDVDFLFWFGGRVASVARTPRCGKRAVLRVAVPGQGAHRSSPVAQNHRVRSRLLSLSRGAGCLCVLCELFVFILVLGIAVTVSTLSLRVHGPMAAENLRSICLAGTAVPLSL